ncbi:MAG: hypothetical protein ACO1SV_06375 [Fimbriimonas sp.]
MALMVGGNPQDEGSRGLGLLAKPGTTYHVEGAAKYGFRLDEARYALRYADRETHTVARRGKKLLVLRYTVTNRQPYAVPYSAGTVNIRTVSPGGGSTRATLAASAVATPRELKANASVSETVWIEVPSGEDTPRLEANVGGSAPLRFDVASFAKPLKDAFVAADGTIRDELEVSSGTKAPLSAFDVTVNGTSWSNLSTIDFMPSSGQRVLVATVTLDNQAPYPAAITRAILVPDLRTEGGETVKPEYTVLQGAVNETARDQVAPGKSVRVRYALRIDGDVKPVALRLTDGLNSGRSLLVRL